VSRRDARRGEATRRREKNDGRTREVMVGSSSATTSVVREVRARIEDVREAEASLREVVDACVEAAMTLRLTLTTTTTTTGVGEGGETAMKTLRAEVEKLCALRRMKLAQIEALKALEREYEGGDGTRGTATSSAFDFAGYLERKTFEYAAKIPLNVEYLNAFDAALKKKSQVLNADEDLVMEDAGPETRNASVGGEVTRSSGRCTRVCV